MIALSDYCPKWFKFTDQDGFVQSDGENYINIFLPILFLKLSIQI